MSYPGRGLGEMCGEAIMETTVNSLQPTDVQDFLQSLNRRQAKAIRASE